MSAALRRSDRDPYHGYRPGERAALGRSDDSQERFHDLLVELAAGGAPQLPRGVAGPVSYTHLTLPTTPYV